MCIFGNRIHSTHVPSPKLNSTDARVIRAVNDVLVRSKRRRVLSPDGNRHWKFDKMILCSNKLRLNRLITTGCPPKRRSYLFSNFPLHVFRTSRKIRLNSVSLLSHMPSKTGSTRAASDTTAVGPAFSDRSKRLSGSVFVNTYSATVRSAIWNSTFTIADSNCRAAEHTDRDIVRSAQTAALLQLRVDVYGESWRPVHRVRRFRPRRRPSARVPRAVPVRRKIRVRRRARPGSCAAGRHTVASVRNGQVEIAVVPTAPGPVYARNRMIVSDDVETRGRGRPYGNQSASNLSGVSEYGFGKTAVGANRKKSTRNPNVPFSTCRASEPLPLLLLLNISPPILFSKPPTGLLCRGRRQLFYVALDDGVDKYFLKLASPRWIRNLSNNVPCGGPAIRNPYARQELCTHLPRKIIVSTIGNSARVLFF